MRRGNGQNLSRVSKPLRNVRRSVSLITFPPGTYYFSNLETFSREQARQDLSKEMKIDISYTDHHELIAERARINFQYLHNDVLSDQDKLRRSLNMGMTKIEEFNPYDDSELDNYFPTVQMWLESILVGMWTAFETLASDLWIAAVNHHPSNLAVLTGSKKRIGKLSIGRKVTKNTISTESRNTEDDDALIRLQIIARHTNNTFNISNIMGNLLKSKFTFISLEGIREAYSMAFSEKETKTRTVELDKVLSDTSLDALSVVRNIIVHKGGIIDEEYERALKTISSIPKGDSRNCIALDGDVMYNLFEPVILTCDKLVIEVNKWLIRTGCENGKVEASNYSI